MKTKDIKELHSKTVDELSKMIVDARENLAQVRLDATQFKVKNTSSLHHMRQDIARMLTVKRGKETAHNG